MNKLNDQWLDFLKYLDENDNLHQPPSQPVFYAGAMAVIKIFLAAHNAGIPFTTVFHELNIELRQYFGEPPAPDSSEPPKKQH